MATLEQRSHTRTDLALRLLDQLYADPLPDMVEPEKIADRLAEATTQRETASTQVNSDARAGSYVGRVGICPDREDV